MRNNNNHDPPPDRASSTTATNNPPPRAVSTRLSLEGTPSASLVSSRGTTAATATGGTTGVSPYNRGRWQRTRFFESHSATSTNNNHNHNPSAGTTSQGGGLSDPSSQPHARPPSHETPVPPPHHDDNDNDKDEPLVSQKVDDHGPMNLPQLRQWIQQSLWEAPEEATYLARLLLSQHASPTHPTNQHAPDVYYYHDVLLLAQAYHMSRQYGNCWRLLHQQTSLVGLPPPPPSSQHCTTASTPTFHPTWTEWVQGLLLACQSLAALHDWTTLLELLESVCRLSSSSSSSSTHDATAFAPHFSNFSQARGPGWDDPSSSSYSYYYSRPLEDEDEYGWDVWYETWTQELHREAQQQQTQQQHHDGPTTVPTVATPDDRVHPLARLCTWRGRASYETGHVLRATVYWTRALHLDGRALQAYAGLLDHQLWTPAQAQAFCHDLQQQQQHDKFPKSRSHPEQATTTTTRTTTVVPPWLIALYWTRIEVPTQTPTRIVAKQPRNPATTTGDKDEPTDKDNNNNNNDDDDDESMREGPTTAVGSSSFFSTVHDPRWMSGATSDEADPASSLLDASSIAMVSSPTTHAAGTTHSHPHGGGATTSNALFASPSAPETADDTDPQHHQQLLQVQVDQAFDDLQTVYQLQKAPQVLAMAAQRAYRRYQWKRVLQYCHELAQLDPTMLQPGSDSASGTSMSSSGASRTVAFVYVAALLLAGHKRTLFQVAHTWVEAQPQQAASWFAVGAYYSACGRPHIAQRHYCRATRLDPHCTPAWIAFGCAFAACDESDQALASFRAAQRLSPGEYLSLLYMGMEYTRTNHYSLAQTFITTAVQTSAGDPLGWHELGVLALLKGQYEPASECFEKVLSLVVVVDDEEGDDYDPVLDEYHREPCQTKVQQNQPRRRSHSPRAVSSLNELVELCMDPYWEATVFNLGHALRKLRRYEAALVCYDRCIALCPHQASGYAAFALVCQCLDETDRAVDYYHQALACQPDHAVSTELLQRALAGPTTNHHHKSTPVFPPSPPSPTTVPNVLDYPHPAWLDPPTTTTTGGGGARPRPHSSDVI